jgi:hypothetical protein
LELAVHVRQAARGSPDFTDMRTDDFDEILKETELDSAKMILRLTSELKEKGLELTALRSSSFEEIQRNNKAKEAEFEALSRAQEERIKKRETEITRLMVEKEGQLWQKHQAMLKEAIDRHRAELEEERARLNEDVAEKEAEILEQKKNLYAEMETLFKKWETEREEDFKNERRTFIEELKLGRATARKEAEDRARQMETLWKEKLAQTAAETSARHELELEEAGRRVRQECLAQTKALTDRQAAEFTLKEQQLHADYVRWLADNKRSLEESFSKHLVQTEADYSSRVAALEASLREAEEELAHRRSQWEDKYAELKQVYAAKEAALETARKADETALSAAEQALSEKYARLEKELAAKMEKLKSELARKERLSEAESAENAAALEERLNAGTKVLEEREAKLSAEREELNRLRNQVADTIRQRETELAGAFENRYALLKESMEESARIKELGLAHKYEDAQNQLSIIAAQKDAALVRVTELTQDNKELKRLLDDKDAYLHTMGEQEHARAAELRKELEKEFSLKGLALRDQLAAGEADARKTLAENLKTETARFAEQYRIKEAGLDAQRDLMNAQARELEAKFLQALRDKEAENAENIKKALASLNSQLEDSRAAAASELAEVRRAAEETISVLRANFEARLKENEAKNNSLVLAREKQAFEAARNELELENKKIEETWQLKLRDMETLRHALEQNLKFALQGKDAALAQTAKLKEDLEALSAKLNETEREKQDLIQENLSKEKDLRQTIEKEFLDRLDKIEKNYLGQMADTIRRGEEKEKTRQGEYFKKLEFIKEEYASKFTKQVKDLEDAYLERETRLLATLEDSYKLKGKALAARFEQMERNYAAALSDKAMQLDNDRAAAESVSRLKSELEIRNGELNARIREYDKQLEEARRTLENSHAAAKKELENEHRMKTAQLDNERAKLKGLLEQEQRLVADLQKREAALQGSYAAKETALIKEFGLSKERLEADYQARLKALKPE